MASKPAGAARAPWVAVNRRNGVAGGHVGSRRPRRPAWCTRPPLVSAMASVFLLLAVPAAQAAGRVALVVGNSDYAHIGRLPNPVNDAADVGAALRRLGFEVTVAENAGLSALTAALRTFTRDSEDADVALVFYAGHGMEMDGVNYLLPVDARLERDTEVRYETVTLDDVLASTSGAGLRLVILDACRNNPLARSMRRTARTRNVSNGSLGDLNEDLLGDETLVAYSAAAGTTADDGEGRNSPYASALLAHLEDPVDIGLMFRRVRGRVLSATNDRQRPHEYSSLLREHYLGASGGGDLIAGPTAASEAALGLDRSARRVLQRRLAAAGFDPGAPDGMFGAATRAAIRAWQSSYGLSATGYLDAGLAEALRAGSSPRPVPVPGGVGGPAAVTGGLPDPVLARQEMVFWESIEDSTNAADFEAYLARWSEGTYVPLARTRLAALRVPPPDPPGPGRPVSTRPDPAPSRPRVGDVFRDCPSCPEMVVIPAGEFLMGSPASEEGRWDDEGPQHRVAVSSFALGRYEVTRSEYAAFVTATGRDVRGGCWVLGVEDNENGGRSTGWSLDIGVSWREPGFAQGASHPVVCVNWRDAQAYAAWLSEETRKSYRLPSEAEWEYAARAQTTTRSYWGNESSARCDYANGQDAAYKRYLGERFGGNWNVPDDCTDGAGGTASVGGYGANDFRLFDMLGNVWEWVEDCWHKNYEGAPRNGGAWTSGGDCGRRVLRGGSWFGTPRYLRSAARLRNTTEARYYDAGFRVARTLD